MSVSKEDLAFVIKRVKLASIIFSSWLEYNHDARARAAVLTTGEKSLENCRNASLGVIEPGNQHKQFPSSRPQCGKK